MLQLLLINLFAIAFSVFDALHDSFVIKELNYDKPDKEKKKYYNRAWHITDAFIKGFVVSCMAIAIMAPAKIFIHEPGNPIEIGWMIGMMLGWRWLTFNTALNLFMGWKLTYRSSNGLDSIPTFWRIFISMAVIVMIIVVNNYMFLG